MIVDAFFFGYGLVAMLVYLRHMSLLCQPELSKHFLLQQKFIPENYMN
jgi:hypothetical protein